ncbi:hypothetical protein [Furfurilactobacillus rossiae]|nr:hypothetical protein [Furfurilactobacillus rossiae]MCF6165228.1 hypothetical protein [Furfurilactobacillus rossiae]
MTFSSGSDQPMKSVTDEELPTHNMVTVMIPRESTWLFLNSTLRVP